MGFKDADEDAVLEASFMHLRSLDDFLRSAGRETEIKARDWVPNWQPTRWLDPRIRARIDWQVVHLSALREDRGTRPEWKPCEYGAALCEELLRFFDEVVRVCPARMPPFETARSAATHGAAKFATFV